MPRHARRRRRGCFTPDFLEARRLPTAYPAFPVDASGPGPQSEARTAVDSIGRVTVVWETHGDRATWVYGRRFESGGRPLGDAFVVDVRMTSDPTSTRVAQDPAGGTVIAWWFAAVYYFQRYDFDGKPLGTVKVMDELQGRAMPVELTEVDAQGFSVLTPDLRLLRYNNDGELTSTTTIATPSYSRGWRIVESTDSRQVTADFATWTEVRSREIAGEAGPITVYDSQVLVASLNPDIQMAGGQPVVVKSTTGSTDPAVMKGYDPIILPVDGVVIAWNEPGEEGGYRVRQLSPPRLANNPWSLGPTLPLRSAPSGESDWIGTLDGESITVAYASPGAEQPAYTQRWLPISVIPSAISWWEPAVAGRTELPEVAGGPFVSTSLFSPLPAFAPGAFWALRQSESGSLIAQRFAAATAQQAAFATTRMNVSESAGQAVVWMVRSGDLSEAATYDYAATSRQVRGAAYRAIPGIDFTPTWGTVTFEPGRSEASFTIPILDDNVPEGIKQIDVSFGATGTDPAGWTRKGTLSIEDSSPIAQRDLTFFDFGAEGFWSWNEVEGWRKLHDADPVAFVATPDRQAFVSFGAAGLWRWDGLLGWTRLNELGPEALTYGLNRDRAPWGQTSPDFTLILDYGPAGLWTWNESADGGIVTGWRKINHVDPAQMVATGQDLFIDFGHGGVWAWDPDQAASDGYTFISSYTPEAMAAYRGHVYLDYGPAGLWSWAKTTGGWIHINGANPASIAVGPMGLFVDYGPFGFWRWDGSTGMTLLSTHSATSFSLAKDSAFAGFATFGLQAWRPSAWTDVNPVNPSRIYATLNQSDAILDFGPSGLWRWNPISGWRKLDGGPIGAPTAIGRM